MITNFDNERTIIKLYDDEGDLRQKITTHDVETFTSF